MERLNELSKNVEAAIKLGAEAEGFGRVDTWIEAFGSSDNVSVIAFGDGFELLSTGGRHMLIRQWLRKRLTPNEDRKVVTILALTFEEAKGPERLPASVTILDPHAAGD